MAYAAQVSRGNPSAFVLLLDQSSSMSDSFSGGGASKAVEAARVVNRFLEELAIKCAKAEGIYDYYEVAVFGYGRGVASALGGSLASGEMHPVSQIADFPLRLDRVTKKVSDGAGGLVDQVVEVPVWVEPQANGMTPMCQALGQAHRLLEGWIANHADSYPPTVINITDGEANDGDPVGPAQSLQSLSTSDGSALIFNCHISSQRGQQVYFPASDEGLVDGFARQLFEMSSVMPPIQLEAARSEGFVVSPSSRGFVFNGSVEDLIRFIDIGTRATLR